MSDDLLAAVEAAAGLAVYGAPPAASRRELVARSIPGFGADSAAAEGVRELLPQIAELHAELADLTDVMVTGPALAARAMALSLGRSLLDEPRAFERTVVVTEAIPPALWQAYLDTGLTPAEARRHFVVVDGPEADLPALGDGAFSAAALIPAALAGVDVAELLDQAEAFAPSLTSPSGNPALALGLALAAAGKPVALISDGTGFEGFGEWAADLLAGVVAIGPGGLTVTFGGSLPPAAVPGGGTRPDLAVNGPLGAQFRCWEGAAAIARALTD